MDPTDPAAWFAGVAGLLFVAFGFDLGVAFLRRSQHEVVEGFNHDSR